MVGQARKDRRRDTWEKLRSTRFRGMGHQGQGRKLLGRKVRPQHTKQNLQQHWAAASGLEFCITLRARLGIRRSSHEGATKERERPRQGIMWINRKRSIYRIYRLRATHDKSRSIASTARAASSMACTFRGICNLLIETICDKG